MVVKVGINGFGRIGRVICRTCLQNDDIELSAINDPAITAEYICYLIKFDSTHGKLNKSVTYSNDEIAVEDHIIKVFHEKLPSTVPWQNAGVQYVIEASGMFTNLDKASGHMQSDCIKRVIVTAPSVDVPMIILGVNDFRLRPEQKVLSCASSTLYCLAPIIKVLEDHYGISEGFVTSIHAMTPSLKPLDGLCLRGKHWRDHRSIHQNIIPATTGACKALAKIIPQVKDKLSGLAFRVPIVNVSVLDITIRLNRNTSLQDIVKNIEKASNTTLKNILKISYEETVSSDYIGESHSCIFDAESSLQLKSNFYKLVCWYENEHSYACRVIDSIFYSERQLSLLEISSEMTKVTAKPSTKNDVVQQTDYTSKEISVECKYGTEFLCSTSQDTGIKAKEPIRVAILKKPLSSAHMSGMATSSTSGREMKRRNEIFKIWNDSNEISKSFVRQNRGSFFHSCISFTPKDVQCDTTKATKYVENIKQDISKMEHVTDDSVMEPQNIKAEANFQANSSKDNVNSAKKSKQEPSQDDVAKSHKLINSMRTFDVCGDYNTSIKVNDSKVLDDFRTEKLTSTYDSHSKDFSQHNVAARQLSTIKDSDKLLSIKLKPQSETFSMQEENQNLKSAFQTLKALEDEKRIIVDNNSFKEQVAKAINTLIEGLEQSFRAASKSNNDGKSEINCSQCETCLENCTCCQIDKSDSKKQYVNMKKIFDNLEAGISNDFNTKVTQLYSQSETKYAIANDQLYEAGNKEDKYLTNQISERINRFCSEPVMISEDRTRSPSSDDRSTWGFKKPKPDIYDKLDSRSGTDSENSFEVNSRKSQVIHIADLTKSLEDLANLDKICRIIEISDELSDKLFSTLSTSEGQELREKKWSFKDLCERIKLDDFCNKVFGKTT